MNTFSNCSNLTNIVIPNSVEYIYYECFKDSGLKSILIPESVKYIDSDVFINCS